MGMIPFPVVAELGDRSVLAVRDEHRVEAEALAAAKLLGDPAFEDPPAALLGPVRRERDELADVARAPPVALDAFELFQRALRFTAGRPPGRQHARAAAEAFDLDARVLAERPAIRR